MGWASRYVECMFVTRTLMKRPMRFDGVLSINGLYAWFRAIHEAPRPFSSTNAEPSH
jgi:hypothetical protein